jgi:uncharacterized protein YbaP (TraB family)
VIALRRLIAILLGLMLAACGSEPSPPAYSDDATPALWEVTGAKGEQAWLFGTVHRLPEGFAWRSAKLDEALAQSDLLVVEIDLVAEADAIGTVFIDKATTPGQPSLLSRVEPDARPALAALLERTGNNTSNFANYETWAAAVILSDAIAYGESKFGVDRVLMQETGERPIRALETVEQQLSIFDTLPETEQADLLESIARDAARRDGNEPALLKAWQSGNMEAIEAELVYGSLADPELREALLDARNRAWIGQIQSLLTDSHRPMIAVGAGHMAGPTGLPALLAGAGYTVMRIH